MIRSGARAAHAWFPGRSASTPLARAPSLSRKRNRQGWLLKHDGVSRTASIRSSTIVSGRASVAMESSRVALMEQVDERVAHGPYSPWLAMPPEVPGASEARKWIGKWRQPRRHPLRRPSGSTNPMKTSSQTPASNGRSLPRDAARPRARNRRAALPVGRIPRGLGFFFRKFPPIPHACSAGAHDRLQRLAFLG
jgi:hypothetical protein